MSVSETQYPPQVARPADFERDGRQYRWDYHTTYGRQLWQVWSRHYTEPLGETPPRWLFLCYACRWKDGTFTDIPAHVPPDGWMEENPKKPNT